MYFIGPLIGGLIMYAIISALVKAPGSSLQSKFVQLGTLKGKTYSEIVSAVGNPSSTSATVGTDGKPVKSNNGWLLDITLYYCLMKTTFA